MGKNKQTEKPIGQTRLRWDDEKRGELLEEQVKSALARMPRKRREIFQLSRDEGLTYKEIAEVKGIKKKSVESHMGRALQFLKDEIGDWT